jgi:PKD repeat protein
MCFPRRLGLLLLGSIILFPGCGNGSEGVPSAELFADPEVCDVPCEVVLYSGVDDSLAQVLTITWDLGDGAKEGDTRLLHTFEAAGSHEVSVTVSNGATSSTDTLTVRAEPQPKTSGTVDESGGSVSQGACTVTVPGGLAPEAFSIELTELPSMQTAAEDGFGLDGFEAFGSAFDVSTLAKSSEAFDLAVREPEIVGADPSKLAWLVRELGTPLPPGNSSSPAVSPAPLAGYLLVPVTGLDADGTARAEIFGSKRLQLVRLSEPLQVDSRASEASVVPKAVPGLAITMVIRHAPTKMSASEYFDAVEAGVTKSYEVLIDDMGFFWPQKSLTVYVGRINRDWDGFITMTGRDTINLNHTLASADDIKKVVAHEFFHLIQNQNSNRMSLVVSFAKDQWSKDGTACWAMDEVFDEIRNNYHATPHARFGIPLLQELSDDYPYEAYQTVAFWKWAESKKPKIIKDILVDRYLTTHQTKQGLPILIENFVIIDHLTSLKKLWPGIDFLEFAYDALYVKDFDTEEKLKDELWWPDKGSPYLGLPKVVEARANVVLQPGQGDSEATARVLELQVRPHLTADVLEVESAGVTGVLHVQFPVVSAALDARVFTIDAATNALEDTSIVRDLSMKQADLTFPFDPDKKAEIIVIDPKWTYTSDTNPVKGLIKIWIADRCGQLPSNVIEATDEEELYAALTSAPAGSAVKLPAGTFTPPIREWPLPEDDRVGTWDTQVLVRNVTLAGAGEGQTTLAMRGDEFGSVGLTTVGSVTLRDLTIDAGEFWGVTAIAAKDLRLCNVTVETYGADGIQFSQWPDGGDGFVGIYNSTIRFTGLERHWGMELSCLDQSGNIGAEIFNSKISGWYVGASYTEDSDNSCTVSLATDCNGFTDNELANVMHTECTPGDCTNWVEECP